MNVRASWWAKRCASRAIQGRQIEGERPVVIQVGWWHQAGIPWWWNVCTLNFRTLLNHHICGKHTLRPLLKMESGRVDCCGNWRLRNNDGAKPRHNRVFVWSTALPPPPHPKCILALPPIILSVYRGYLPPHSIGISLIWSISQLVMNTKSSVLCGCKFVILC